MVVTDVMMALLMDMLLVLITCNIHCNGVLIQSDPVLQFILSTTASAATDGTVLECIEPSHKYLTIPLYSYKAIYLP